MMKQTLTTSLRPTKKGRTEVRPFFNKLLNYATLLTQSTILK